MSSSSEAPQPVDVPAPKRRSWVRVVVPLGVIVCLLLSGVAALTALRGDDAPAPTPVNVRVRDRAVRAILARRAAAVLHRDRGAFLADVSPTDPRARRDQRRLFANLRQVDFASWRYQLLGRESNRPELAEVYDAPYYLPLLLLHYEIAGYDRGPVARPQVLTFVRRDGRWWIASDHDADASLPEPGHNDPWDRRAMLAVEGKHVLVLGDAVDDDVLGGFRDAADDAVESVAAMWPTGWRRKVVIVAVRDRRLVETYFRTALADAASVVAIAVPQTDLVAGWSPAPTPAQRAAFSATGSRVILNARFFQPANDANVDLLTHEITHVATQSDTRAGAPAWLIEGAAEYTAFRTQWPFSLPLPAGLRREVAAGSVYLATSDFYSRRVADHYFAGFLASAYVAVTYGEDTLRRYYRRLGHTDSEIDTLDRMDAVSRSVLHQSTESLQRAVARYARDLDGG